MEFRVLGWPDDGPRLDLDHERFAYAGNFGTGRTGIAAAFAEASGAGTSESSRDESVGAADAVTTDRVLGAASFDEDRAADGALRVRYVTVREDRRGEGIGARLLAFVVDRGLAREFDRVRIGANNPIAYRACYRAGFEFTGEESGMGELVLEAPPPGDRSDERPGDRSGAVSDNRPSAGSGDRSGARYRDGLARFESRDLPDHQRAVLDRHGDGPPPDPVDAPPPDGSEG